MKQWFLFYTSEPEKLAQDVRELQSKENQEETKLAWGVRDIIQRPVGDKHFPPQNLVKSKICAIFATKSTIE